MKNVHTIILNPRITEKTLRSSMGELSNRNTNDSNAIRQYTFIVDRNANKIEIKKAFEAIYNEGKKDNQLTVEKVHTSVVRGKARRVGAKKKGKTSSYKKAVITLAKGQILEEYGV